MAGLEVSHFDLTLLGGATRSPVSLFSGGDDFCRQNSFHGHRLVETGISSAYFGKGGALITLTQD